MSGFEDGEGLMQIIWGKGLIDVRGSWMGVRVQCQSASLGTILVKRWVVAAAANLLCHFFVWHGRDR